jgi:hypothetical protein
MLRRAIQPGNAPMTSRKDPSTAFWATVVVVVALTYLASFGPFIWLSDHQLLKDGSSLPAVSRVYVPIIVAGRSCYIFRRAMDWYVSLWSDFDVGWFEWNI